MGGRSFDEIQYAAHSRSRDAHIRLQVRKGSFSAVPVGNDGLFSCLSGSMVAAGP
jgi:hypothetical protein